jgi:predicted nuclease of predicted toxin-antitoxin system
MRFLVDAQLPPALARWLEQQGHVAEHVIDCGLNESDDLVIWEAAAELGAVIVTKDEDFAVRRVFAASGPPVLWLRCGNTSRRALLAWLDPHLPVALDALERGERLVEIA